MTNGWLCKIKQFNNCHIDTKVDSCLPIPSWENNQAITRSSISQPSLENDLVAARSPTQNICEKMIWWLPNHYFETTQADDLAVTRSIIWNLCEKTIWRPIDRHLETTQKNDLATTKLHFESSSKRWPSGCKIVILEESWEDNLIIARL